jgi:hypothetical protein
MRTARPNTTRRQIEMAAEDLDFDALAIGPAELAESGTPVVEDELAGVADLLAEFDYEVYDLPEFDSTLYGLPEFETAELASIVPLHRGGDAVLGEVA